MSSLISKVELRKQWVEANNKSFKIGLKLFDINEGVLRKYHTGKTLAFCLSYGASLENAISKAFNPKQFNNFDLENLHRKMKASPKMLNRYDRLLALALSGNEEATLLELSLLKEEALERKLEEVFVVHHSKDKDNKMFEMIRESNGNLNRRAVLGKAFKEIKEDLKKFFK